MLAQQLVEGMAKVREYVLEKGLEDWKAKKLVEELECVLGRRWEELMVKK